MPCFMKNNHGFKPSQIKLIKKRGLNKLAIKWAEIVRQGTPNIRNPLISTKANEVISIIYSGVNRFLRFENEKFDSEKILKLLDELKSMSEEKLQQYISKIEKFIIALNREKK